MSSCKMRRSQRFLIARYRIQSSANNLISERMSLAMSLMYSKNNKGPRTVPCGTPDETVLQDDWVPFSVIRWRRHERKDSTHRKVPPRMPYEWSFTKRRLWGTESKAFEKSKIAMSVLLPESRLLARSHQSPKPAVFRRSGRLWNHVGEAIRYLILETD